MSDQRLTYQELLQIIELIQASSRFTEFRLKCGDIEVDIRRAAQDSILPAHPAAAELVRVRPGAPEKPSRNDGTLWPSGASLATAERRLSYPDGAVLITSPMVGTFYRAPEPGALPFVEIGQHVEPDSIVCIIEVMKLMNSIPAGRKGRVVHIGPEDGEPVQFGQVLIAIEPH